MRHTTVSGDSLAVQCGKDKLSSVTGAIILRKFTKSRVANSVNVDDFKHAQFWLYSL